MSYVFIFRYNTFLVCKTRNGKSGHHGVVNEDSTIELSVLYHYNDITADGSISLRINAHISLFMLFYMNKITCRRCLSENLKLIFNKKTWLCRFFMCEYIFYFKNYL